MNESIKKQLAELEKIFTPPANIVRIVKPDGQITEVDALDYWQHRNEWHLATWEKQRGDTPVFYLVFAEILDHGIPEAAARGDAAEVERLTSERDFMNKSIKKKTAEFKDLFVPLNECYCLVEKPDGKQTEVLIEKWYKHRKDWKWLKITRSTGSKFAIYLLLVSIADIIAEDAMREGDKETALRFTREADGYRALYEREMEL